MEITDILQQNTVFGCMAETELKGLQEIAARRHYNKGQYLTYSGDVWPFLFFLIKGSVSAVKESLEGRSILATSFKAGEVFWGVSFFHPQLVMPVDLKVDQQASLLIWSREQMLPAILGNGHVAWELSRLMVSRMLRASELVEELAFQPVAGRLAKLLIDFPGQASAGPIARSLTLDDMAARVGSTREMVCRLLQRFADEELIKITRTEFEITNRSQLVSIVQKVRG